MSGLEKMNGIGVEVRLKNDDAFLIVCETLTRIGILSYPKKTVYQSCHLLHKQGHYYILHFKELFKLDGKNSSLDESDIGRRNTIANLLSEWNLVELVNPELSKAPVAKPGEVRVLSCKEKSEWTLTAKYSIGARKESYGNKESW